MKTLLKISLAISTIACLTSLQTKAMTGGDDDQSNGTITVAAISGAGSITKNEAGTLTLSGANTYSGTTTVSGGTLSLSQSEFDRIRPVTSGSGKIVITDDKKKAATK